MLEITSSERRIMTLKQEAVFIGIAVIIGLATMIMVRLVYDEGDLKGKAAEHPVRDSLPAWISLTIYLWLKLIAVMAKLIKFRYALQGFKIVRSVTLTPSEPPDLCSLQKLYKTLMKQLAL